MRTSTPSPASGRDGGPVSVRDGARSDSVPPPSDRRGSGPPPSPREPVEDTPSTGEAEARDSKRAKDAKGKTPKLTSKPAKDGEEAAEGEAAGAEVEAEGADDDAPPPSAPPRATFVPRTGEAKPADSSGSPKGSGS
jgi:hypothetical protein